MDATMAPPDRLLARPHNSRLGPLIHAFNLPATPEVCVGASTDCAAVCYAKAFLFRLHEPRHRSHLGRSRRDRFVADVAAEILREAVRVVRVHTAGDFYDAAYVDRWARIARACPGTTFFAYTRSWRRPESLPALVALARRPNVRLWFSEDRGTGRPPTVPGVRRAYLLGVGEPESSVPADADLVCRASLPRRPGQPRDYGRPAKRANGVLICPKEQGIARRVGLTCSSCRICFTDRDYRREPPGAGPDRSVAAPSRPRYHEVGSVAEDRLRGATDGPDRAGRATLSPDHAGPDGRLDRIPDARGGGVARGRRGPTG